MKEKHGCPTHGAIPEKDFKYHPVRGIICHKCGRLLQLQEFTTVNPQ